MIVQCQNCKKQVNAPDNWDRNIKCNSCGSYFTELTNVNYPSVSNQLNQIGQDIGNNINSIPHIIIGKDKKTPNLNTQNPNLGHLDKADELFGKARRYGLYAAIILVMGYALFRILGIFLGF